MTLNWSQIDKYCEKIAFEILRTSWRPKYIVGISSGGLVPAVILSQLLKVPLYTLKVSTQNNTNDCEHNLWIPEDVLGYSEANTPKGTQTDILVVNCINDTGQTIEWIKNDWQESCLPQSLDWAKIWHSSVKFAVLVNNLSSSQSVDFYAAEINKQENNVLIEFPWHRS